MRDEGRLIEAARRGDQAAFAELVRGLQPQALAFAAGMLRERDEACDAVQEAFVQAWLHLASFDPQRSFRPWLLGITAKRCLDRLRQRRRFGDFFRRFAPAAATSTTGAGGARLETAELLAKLPPRERQAIWLQLAASCSAREIGAALGCSESTARVHLYNARRRLHKEVQKHV